MTKAMQVNVLKLIGAVILIASQIPVECHATGNVFDMKKLNCTFNENYFNVTNSECILKAEGGRNKLAGGHAQLIKAVDDVMLSVQVYLGSKLLDGQYNLLFNVTENLCDVATNMKKAKIGEIMRPLWEQHTNIPIGCPIDAREYFVKDVEYDLLGQIIPVTILNGRYKIDIKVQHKNQLIMRVLTLITVTPTTNAAKKHRNNN